jgi:hypothetical protein
MFVTDKRPNVADTSHLHPRWGAAMIAPSTSPTVDEFPQIICGFEMVLADA